LKIVCKNIALMMGKNGQIRKLSVGNKDLDLLGRTTGYLLASEIATVSNIKQKGQEISAILKTTEYSGRLTIKGEKRISIAIQSQEKHELSKVGLVFFLPEEAQIHLPERYNRGRIIDKDMPVGQVYTCGFAYHFTVVKLEENWLSLSSPIKLRSNVNMMAPYQESSKVTIFRIEDGFYLQYEWCPEVALLLDSFTSLEEAASDYHSWLKEAFNLVKREDNPYIPEWVENTKLIIPLAMWHSHGEILHNYQHVIDLCKNLHNIGCPKDTLLCITGWDSRFDSSYPEYAPADKLGGEEKFREMVDTAHTAGKIHLLCEK